jgi:hypothetical protein
MSGKNRAFALAVATAALVGLSAPVASAASFSGPSGFNNDSIVNISGNQLLVQACNDYLPVNGDAGTQVILASIAAALGQGSGDQTSTTNTSCTQNPTAATTTTTTTNSAPSDLFGDDISGDSTSVDTTSGFNNDSIVNISGNQLPTQACNDTLPTNTTGTQTLATGLAGALGIPSSGATSAAQDSSCTQNPGVTNTSSVTSTN